MARYLLAAVIVLLLAGVAVAQSSVSDRDKLVEVRDQLQVLLDDLNAHLAEPEPEPTTEPEPEPTTDPDVDNTVSGAHDGFTVPAGQTWEVTDATSTANVVVEGTLQMRPGSSLTFTDVDESAFVGGGTEVAATDVGLWVMGSGVLDVQGTPVQGWNRTGQHETWRPEHEYVRAPFEPGERDAVPWSLGDPVPCTTFQGVDYCTEIANLTRDVNIGSVDGGQAHMFIRSDQPQTIRYASLSRMAPEVDPDTPDGRYALHFHHSGEGSRGSIIEGVVVRDADDHAFAPHESHGITFRDTVAYNVVNTAYWWDPGDFSNDIRYERALAVQVRGSRDKSGSLAGFRMAKGDGNVVTESVAAGVREGRASSGFNWREGPDTNKWEFTDNVAHNNVQGVYHWVNEPFTPTVHEHHGFVAYRNGWFGIEQGAYRIKAHWFDTVLFGNGRYAVKQRGAPNDLGGFDPGVLYKGGAMGGAEHVISLSHMNFCGAGSAIAFEDLRLSDWTVTPVYVNHDECSNDSHEFRVRFTDVLADDRDLTPQDFTIDAIPPGGTITVERTDGQTFVLP